MTARLGLFLLASIAAVGCEGKDEKNAYAPPPPPEVIVANPEQRDVTTYKKFTGLVEASESVDLRARVQGFLDKMNFQPGQRVKKGDLLFVIDKREYQAAVERAEATLASRKSALSGADNDAKLARELADQKAGPEIDALIKTAKRDAMASEVAAAEAVLVDAKLNLSFCDITSPIDGRITANYVDTGNLVGRGEPTLLATIVQAVPAYVSLDVSEADVLEVRKDRTSPQAEPGQIAPGQWRPCELALTGDTDFKYKGRVDYVDPELNKQTGTLRVRTVYENKDEMLVPGLFATVRFPITSTKSILVPDAALLRDQQGRYALVVNDKSEVEAKRVKIGALDGSMRVVDEGLSPEDHVIVLGVLKARPGSKVTPKSQTAAAK
jgi:RND family efflux transporter MFP subunit